MEKKGGTFTQIVTIYYTNPSLSLSESLSPTIRSKNEIQIQKKRKEEHLHYPTLKHRNPSLKSKTASFWTSTGVFIGIREFQKRRRSHASKINAWAHQLAVESQHFLRQNQGLRSLVLVRGCAMLRGPSWYIRFRVYSSESSSNMRKSLNSMHLLEVPLLVLQVMRIQLPKNGFN